MTADEAATAADVWALRLPALVFLGTPATWQEQSKRDVSLTCLSTWNLTAGGALAIFNPFRLPVRLREGRALSQAHTANQQSPGYPSSIQIPV